MKNTDIKFYLINLDERIDRLKEFINNINSNNFNEYIFNRISAVRDNDFGGIGCGKSHIIALTDFILNSKENYCVVFEDDFRFKTNRKQFELNFSNLLNEHKDFKVWLLSGTKVICFDDRPSFPEIFESQSTAGYMVTREYAKKLLKTFIDSVSLMEKYRFNKNRKFIYDKFSIDQHWKILQHGGGWHASIPMLGYQCDSFSDIEGGYVNYESIAS